jgi:hypothetical protein
MSSRSTTSVVCTLCEGDYHLGAAALLNSLVAGGFSGVFVIGWRGAPPPWHQTLELASPGSRVVQGVRVILEEMRTDWVLAHVKPHFMMDILERIVPDADAICYADPDIVMDAPWSFFESWIGRGVALCEDSCFPTMSRHHYLRLCWSEFARERLGVTTDPTNERGYNSGFVGLQRAEVEFLQTWRKAIDQLDHLGVPLGKLKPGSRLDPFFGTDQDTMNIAAMVHHRHLSTLGPEGMGFSGGMDVMSHAVEPPKPWRRSFVWDLLRTGRPVPRSHRHYWKHASGPVKAWNHWRLLLKRLDLQTAIVLSRFYHSA